MIEEVDELESVWKTEALPQVDPSLVAVVTKQTRNWYMLLVVDIGAILVGIFVPLATVIQNPEPFWILWAANLWGVVGIAGWFTFARAKSLLADLDQTTDAYERVLRTRYAHQIRASRIGIVLAAFQFVAMPFLCWMQYEARGFVGMTSVFPFLIVLVVMAAYIVKMRSVAKNTRRKLEDLQRESAD